MHMPSIDWLCIMITQRPSTRENIVYIGNEVFILINYKKTCNSFPTL